MWTEKPKPGLRIPLLAMLLGVITAAGCGDPIGSPCRFTGSGFTASDNCRYQCLETRNIVCPDGAQTRPQVCSGARHCSPGECPHGQVCYHVADPFEEQSYCVPETICGAYPTDALAKWSAQSVETAAALRDEYAERKARRLANPKPTSPAEPLQPQP